MQLFNDILTHYSWQGLSLMLLIVILFGIQLYYYAVAYYRINTYRLTRKLQKRAENPPVSIVVPVRGENEYFLSVGLPVLLSQQYHTFEVVVVYIGDDNDYYDELQRIRDNYSYMRLTKMGGNGPFYITTKQALNVGIKSAQYHSLLFTTPGAIPATEQWVATMAKGFERGTVVIAPAVPKFESDTLKTYLMRLVEFQLLRNAMAAAVVGKPYYAPRSNFGFDRRLYERTRGYNHLNLDNGENDLYLQEIASNKRNAVVMSRHSVVTEERIDDIREWTKIMRYNASTQHYYPTSVKVFANRELGSRALFFVASLAAIVVLPLELKLGAIGLIIARYIVVVWSTHRTARRIGEHNIVLRYWIYDLVGPALEWALWSKKEHNTQRIWR